MTFDGKCCATCESRGTNEKLVGQEARDSLGNGKRSAGESRITFDRGIAEFQMATGANIKHSEFFQTAQVV